MTKTVYILLFRGVGGATQLPVKPLREKLTEAGFEKAATYINSGNALLASGKGRETVRKEVAAICKTEFGFDKDIHVVTRAEWAELIAKNPFPDALDVPKFLHAAEIERVIEAAETEHQVLLRRRCGRTGGNVGTGSLRS